MVSIPSIVCRKAATFSRCSMSEAESAFEIVLHAAEHMYVKNFSVAGLYRNLEKQAVVIQIDGLVQDDRLTDDRSIADAGWSTDHTVFDDRACANGTGEFLVQSPR